MASTFLSKSKKRKEENNIILTDTSSKTKEINETKQLRNNIAKFTDCSSTSDSSLSEDEDDNVDCSIMQREESPQGRVETEKIKSVNYSRSERDCQDNDQIEDILNVLKLKYNTPANQNILSEISSNTNVLRKYILEKNINISIDRIVKVFKLS